eukprot:GGOE01043863.1.p1 GENE.GGOE01043863.1~~GGOE01043863.1.p1  ORF type:complete len:546 (-),score=173.19 GGOE01043863.1:263-1900(-)
MSEVEGKNIVVAKELPRILRDFAKAAKARKLDSSEEFNVFATRYFASLAGYHVEGYPDLELNGGKAVQVISQQVAMPTTAHPRDDNVELEFLLKFSVNPSWTVIEHEVYAEICALRADPPAYAGKVQALKRFFDEQSQALQVPGGVLLSANEGWFAYHECIEQLRRTSPLAPLQYSLGLTLAGLVAMADADSPAAPRALAEKFGTFDEELGSCVAQSLCFNQLLPQSIVLHLLVDDGYMPRGNRANLLSEEVQHVGISFQDTACSLLFASNYRQSRKLPGVPLPEVPAVFDYGLQLSHRDFEVVPKDQLAAAMQSDPLASPPQPPEFKEIRAEVDGAVVHLMLLDPPLDEVEVSGPDRVFILRHKRGHVTASLEPGEEGGSLSDILGRGCLCQAKDGLVAIHVHFPRAGQYCLSVLVDATGSREYVQVFQYCITASGVDAPPHAFPTTFVQSRYCYLHQPLAADLPATSVLTLFVVQAIGPYCSAFAVLIGEELVYLLRDETDETLYSGRVRVGRGDVKVVASIEGKQYEVFGFTGVEPKPNVTA